MKLTIQSALTMVAALLFTGLAIFTTFWLSSAGFDAFDGKVLGYSFNAAQMYLDDLTAAQRALYLGPFRIADTIFPALFALSLLLWFRTQTTGAFRIAMTSLASVYLVLDYTENMLVARLLKAGADGITPQGVALASGMTQIKWAAMIVCFGAALWLRFRMHKGVET